MTTTTQIALAKVLAVTLKELLGNQLDDTGYAKIALSMTILMKKLDMTLGDVADPEVFARLLSVSVEALSEMGEVRRHRIVA